jgi:hypothetical protein
VVIVDPDEVAVLDIVDDRLGKEAVHLLIGGPGRFIEGDFARMVVEERPEDGV